MTGSSFVMTIKLDDTSFSLLQAWRTRYFPAARNHLQAHLTLLHTMSSEQVARLTAAWPRFEDIPAVGMKFTAPRALGNGVAISVESAELSALRAQLIEAMAGGLTRQDQQPFRAHVTIQNKVSLAEAKALYASLQSSFEPWCGAGTAVLIWRYLGGPWAAEAQLPLSGVIAPPTVARSC